MWAILKTDLTFEFHEGVPTLKEMQNAVGGWVEAIASGSDITFWCNEEGKLIDSFEPNRAATSLLWAAHGPIDMLYGDIVMTGGVDEEGDTIGLTKKQAQEYYFVFTGRTDFQMSGTFDFTGRIYYDA